LTFEKKLYIFPVNEESGWVMRKYLKGAIFCVVLGLGVIAIFFEKTVRENGSITVYGNVDVRQVDLSFRVFGRVVSLLHEEGDWIEPGELLATMEKKPYTDELTQAQAQVIATEASLENETKMLERRLELIESKSVSQEDLETVLANYNVLQATLEQNKAAVAIAQKNVEDTEIFAPTSGTILTRIREPGSVVNPADPVYTLSIASPVSMNES
jgi:HlyD family secretion protein